MQQNAFVQSMKTIAESLVKNAGFDKTRTGKIIGVNEITNTYTVKIDGLVYNNVKVANDITCRVGDTVVINIPMNNPTQLYISSSMFSPDSLGNKLIQVNTLVEEAEDKIDNIGIVLGELYQLNIAVSYRSDTVLHDGSQMAVYTASLKHITADGIVDVTDEHANELHWYLENPSGRTEYSQTGYLSSPGKVIQVGSKYYLYGQSMALEWRTGNTVNLIDRVTLFNNELIEDKIEELSDATSIATNQLQYFWFDGDVSSSTDKGVHITFLPKDAFQANPTYGGVNLLETAQGLAIRDGLQELVGISIDGLFVNALIDNVWKSVANFGQTVRIGQTSGASRIIQDYHSMQMIDLDDVSYFYVSDLRSKDITDTFTGDGSTRTFYLTLTASNTSYTVKRNGTTITSGFSKYTNRIVFTTAPTSSQVITVEYTSNTYASLITEKFEGNNSDKTFYLSLTAYNTNYTVKKNDVVVPSSSITRYTNRVVFTTAPTYYDEITVEYYTTDREAKAYTFGTRRQSQYNYIPNYIGAMSIAEGLEVISAGYCTHAEGRLTEAGGEYSHAEGYKTIAFGEASHAEGRDVVIEGDYCHGEGYSTGVSGLYNHAEGHYNTILGEYNNYYTQSSHVEGEDNYLYAGSYSHIGGYDCDNYGECAFLHGYGLTNSYSNGFVIGKYNEDLNKAFIIGNGTGYASSNRANAFTVDWSGKVSLYAKEYSGDQAGYFVHLNNTQWLSLLIGSGGNNHGVFSHKRAVWLVYNNNSDNYCRTGFASGFYNSSDRKIKNDIQPIDYAKDFIMALKPVEYYVKQDKYKSLGFIAQDVYDACIKINKKLSLVGAEGDDYKTIDVYSNHEFKDDEMNWGMSYTNIIAPLVKVVQDQQKEIDEIKKKLKENV